MKPALRSGLLLAALAGLAALVSGCADDKLLASDITQANDFGRAVHEDLAAQIADPDAAYRGPPPPTSGEKTEVGFKRYTTDTMKQPQSISTQSGGGGSGGGGGGGGSSGGTSGGTSGGGGTTGP
ncbi:MAG TPA: hypothetical protein VG166_15355 [Caulobacteraceae bacterium]|jgi:type IV pilus biogenesis protein CpaD/CtpE|nr:hypothetical protein [Caulobacteraceae bacterium]